MYGPPLTMIGTKPWLGKSPETFRPSMETNGLFLGLGETSTASTSSRRGSSPLTTATPLVAWVNSRPAVFFTRPSMYGEYRLPSAAQERHQVSEWVYSA